MKKDPEYDIIRLALLEDIGSGDITTRALGLGKRKGRAFVVAKASGIISGTSAFRTAYRMVSRDMTFRVLKRDGSSVVPGDEIIRINGPLDAILTGERTAMNLLCHLSGVATLTSLLVKETRDHHAKILDTRKTMPGLRALQKKAVRDGGGSNHRMGLYDMYLIKENHIWAAGGMEKALKQVLLDKRRTKALIEVEVKDLKELELALSIAPDYILLDNFTIPLLIKAVHLARLQRRRVILEASGNVSLKNIARIAATGVDRISIGKMTHSAQALDLSLKVVPSP